MGNVIPLFPAVAREAQADAAQASIPLPDLQEAVKRPRIYQCLDPLPEYFQDDQDYFRKLSQAQGRLVRSALKPPEEAPPPQSEEEDSEEMEFSVEAILKKRIRQGQLEYFVKWEHSPEEANTWEPAQLLKRYLLLIQEFENEWKADKLEQKRKNIPPPGPGRGWNSRRRAARTAREAKKRKREEQLAQPKAEPVKQEFFPYEYQF